MRQQIQSTKYFWHATKQAQNSGKSQRIMEQCIAQNQIFKKYFHNYQWNAFHNSHYDWWAFPINQSSSYGGKYQVFANNICQMKNNKKFMDALISNAKMVCWSWGYDLQNGRLLKDTTKDQQWQNWPIRLYKITKSLQIFGCQKQYLSAVKYGIYLISKNNNFHYHSRNLALYFEAHKNSQITIKLSQNQVKHNQNTQKKYLFSNTEVRANSVKKDKIISQPNNKRELSIKYSGASNQTNALNDKPRFKQYLK